jgi:hypothetical protein
LTDQDEAIDAQNINGVKAFKTSATILNYETKSVVIQIPNDSNVILKCARKNRRYIVELLPNFFTSAMAFKALNSIEKENYEKFFLDFNASHLPIAVDNNVLPKVVNFSFMNTSVGENAPQSSAIKHIVNRTSFPSPYVIFGPPGTGKCDDINENSILTIKKFSHSQEKHLQLLKR